MQMLAPDAGTAALEASLLGVLLDVGSAREGAQALLDALAPVLDDQDAAIVARDRDGLTLHVLAERGAPTRWPERLEPQLAAGAHFGVDRGTGVMVVPLRARGRVVGALLLADAAAAPRILHRPGLSEVIDTVAGVLAVLLSRIDDALRRQEAAARALDGIADSMAHQVANPLAGASAIAELLAQDVADEGHRAAIQQIRHELGRAFSVVNDALDFHRDTHAQDGVVDLNTVVERVARFRGYAIREQGIQLATEFSPDWLPVRGDLRRLEHALLLALRSAELRSHGTANRRIDVRVFDRLGECCVAITDSGTGDALDLSPRYFDAPLAELDRGARDTATPDLGLVESLVRASGGRLEARASKLEGGTLTVVLPRGAARMALGSRKAV